MLAGGTTELNTALGILADIGIKGSEGGTALRNTILSLASPTDKAAELMEDLGVSAYDSKGQLKPLNETLGDLNKAMEAMSDNQRTQVLNTIFNKNDLKAVNGLLAATQAKTFDLGETLDGLGIDATKNKDAVDKLMAAFRDGTDRVAFMQLALKETNISVEQAGGLYDELTKAVSGTGSRFDELSGMIEASEGASSSMAATLNSGTKGAITTMKSALEGVAITIGERIIPYVTKFAEFVSALCTKFQELDPAVQDTIVVVGALVAAIGPALVIIGTIVSLIGKAVVAFSSIFSVISSIGTAFVTLWGWISSAGAAIGTFIAGISWPVVAIIAAIAAVIAAIWWLWNNWDTACQWVSTAWEWLKDSLAMVGEVIMAGLQAVGDFFAAIFIAIGKCVCDGVSAIGNWIISGFTKIRDFFVSILTAISTFFQNIWNGIVNFIKTIIQTIINLFFAFLEMKFKKWEAIFKAIHTVFTKTWNAITSFFENTMSFLTNLASNTWSGLKNLVTGFATAIKNGVVGAFQGLKNGVMGVWNAIVNGIKGCVNGILKMVNGMIRGLNKINVKVPDWVPALGGKSIGFNIPEIPLLATGGQVNFGTAIVGEAGPELLQQTAHGTRVTPLSTHEKAAGIGGALGATGLTVRIDKFINNTDRDIEELSYRLADHFQKNMKGRGLSYE